MELVSHSKPPQRSHGSHKQVSTFTFVLYIYFLISFFLHFSARVPAYGSIRPTLLLVVILAVLLFLQKEKFRGWTKEPIMQAILLLLLYLVLSLPLVEWPGSVIRSNLSDFVRAIVFLFFTVLIIDSEKRLKWFLIVFISCQVIRVLEPLYLNITEGYWGSSTYLSTLEFANRLSGAPADVINPNELGFVIATIVPFLHYLLWPLGWKFKALYVSLIPLLLYALILTMSRGGFLALLVVAFIVFKESKQKMALIVLAIVVLIGAISVMNPVQKERYLSLIDSEAEGGASVEGRIGGMIAEVKLGLTRPIVGHGLGTTSEAKFHKFGSTKVSHNLYAELLIEIGIIGFCLFLRFLFKIAQKLKSVRDGLKSATFSEQNFYFRLNRVLIAVFWMYAVYSINYWGLSQYYWYLFGGMVIAFGRLVGAELRASESETSQTGVPKSRFPLADRVRGAS